MGIFCKNDHDKELGDKLVELTNIIDSYSKVMSHFAEVVDKVSMQTSALEDMMDKQTRHTCIRDTDIDLRELMLDVINKDYVKRLMRDMLKMRIELSRTKNDATSDMLLWCIRLLENDILNGLRIEYYETPVGATFDSECHQAIKRIETDNPNLHKTIAKSIIGGYRSKDFAKDAQRKIYETELVEVYIYES